MFEDVTLQKPTVGRIIHYTPVRGNSAWAAVIVLVHPTGSVNLRVFSPTSADVGLLTEVPFSGVPKEGCWTWPPRL